nr:MAG TPA: hypothetical protein [Caudoviricetes sp.]
MTTQLEPSQNCNEQRSKNPNYRITDFEYNEYTYDLVIKQNPDVVKRVKIKSGIGLEELAHLNPVIRIFSEGENVPIEIKGNNPHLVKTEVENGYKVYYYYTWDSKFNKYIISKLNIGWEFFNLEDGIKYRVTSTGLEALEDTTNLDIQYTESEVIISNNKGTGVTIFPASESKAGVMSAEDKIKLGAISSYINDANFIIEAPNIYLHTVTYFPDTNNSKEETFLIPVATLAHNGLLSSKQLMILENLSECVTEIKPTFISTEEGLTYVYVTRDPNTLESLNHEITIPVATTSSNGLLPREDKQFIDNFRIVYSNQKIQEIFYEDTLLTNEKFVVTRDQDKYYIEGNDGTSISIEAFDPSTGKAGLLTGYILDSLNLYTNTTPIVEAIGGIKKKEVFDRVPYSKMWDKLLYPDIPPFIETFTVHPLPGIYEKESELYTDLIEITAWKKSYNISSIRFSDNNYQTIRVFTENVKDGGIFNYNTQYKLDTINKSEIFFRGVVTDVNANAAEIVSDKFIFVYPFLYGVIEDGDSLSTDLINSLNKIVDLKGSKTVDFTANYQKVIFGYPEYYGELKYILDSSGLNNINFFESRKFGRVTTYNTVPYIFYISCKPITIDNDAITFKF